MRKAMICVSMMLALLQLWPMLFGHNPDEAQAAEPARIAAVSVAPVTSIAAAVATSPVAAPSGTIGQPMESCLKTYVRVERICGPNQSCHSSAASRWQVCEATGFWRD